MVWTLPAPSNPTRAIRTDRWTPEACDWSETTLTFDAWADRQGATREREEWRRELLLTFARLWDDVEAL